MMAGEMKKQIRLKHQLIMTKKMKNLGMYTPWKPYRADWSRCAIKQMNFCALIIKMTLFRCSDISNGTKQSLKKNGLRNKMSLFIKLESNMIQDLLKSILKSMIQRRRRMETAVQSAIVTLNLMMKKWKPNSWNVAINIMQSVGVITWKRKSKQMGQLAFSPHALSLIAIWKYLIHTS